MERDDFKNTKKALSTYTLDKIYKFFEEFVSASVQKVVKSEYVKHAKKPEEAKTDKLVPYSEAQIHFIMDFLSRVPTDDT